jgi:peptidoglycan/xylan/chitin deacetylase (PgdA/CDA1 family)
MIRLALFALAFLLVLPTLASAQNTAAIPPRAGVTEKITFTDVNVDGPYIAMTFDDGPHATNTPKLLEIAAQRHIKLTFFVLGQCVEQNPAVFQREVAEGHEIGNHSWSHPNLAKLSDAAVRSQLQRTEDIILKTAGVKPKLMRPPYGELTKRQRVWVNRDFGYEVILWDVDPLDWKRPGPDVVARRIIAGTRAGSIILSHDIHPPTIEAIPQVFDALLAKGFKFVTVSELLAMDKGGERPEVANHPGVPSSPQHDLTPPTLTPPSVSPSKSPPSAISPIEQNR